MLPHPKCGPAGGASFVWLASPAHSGHPVAPVPHGQWDAAGAPDGVADEQQIRELVPRLRQADDEVACSAAAAIPPTEVIGGPGRLFDGFQNKHRGSGFLAQRDVETLHELRAGSDLLAAVEVLDLVPLLRQEVAKFDGERLSRRFGPAEDLHDAFI